MFIKMVSLEKLKYASEDASANNCLLKPVAANDNDRVTGYAKPADSALPIFDPRNWEGVEVPPRRWIVPGMIPDRTVTLLSGNGGSGKTGLCLQLMAAMAFGTEWLGKEVTKGRSIYYGAEDEVQELHRRFAGIVEHEGRSLKDLEGIRVIPMTERDPMLATPSNSRGLLTPTSVFSQLSDAVDDLAAKLVVLDASADVFGGDEISRTQVRAFVSMLRTAAIKSDCAIVLLAHPSLTGIATGTGLSGSTAWNNSVRSRLYLEEVKDDPSARVLKLEKANYGPRGSEIKLRWHNGSGRRLLKRSS
jgi:RecA-family ATPase